MDALDEVPQYASLMAADVQLTLFAKLPAPCRQCHQSGLEVSAAFRPPESGTMMLLCNSCGHVEFASVPARDMRLLVDLTSVMQSETGKA